MDNFQDDASFNGAPLAAGVYQAGVYDPHDAAMSAISFTTGGLLGFTLSNAIPIFFKTTGGVVLPRAYNGGAYSSTPSLPASGQYAVIGVEIDTQLNVTLVKGSDTGTQLNTGSLISSNTPATTAGKLRVADFAVWNNSGTYNFSDHTTTATQGTNWIDRRPWARGLYASVTDTNAASFTTLSPVQTWITIANWQMRVELSAGSIIDGFIAANLYGNGSSDQIGAQSYIDGGTYTMGFGLFNTSSVASWIETTASQPYRIGTGPAFDIPPGSHLIQMRYYVLQASGSPQYFGGTNQVWLREYPGRTNGYSSNGAS